MIDWKRLDRNLIFSNLHIDKDDLDIKRVQLINYIIILAVPVLLFFTYANFLLKQEFFAYSNIISAAIMTLSFFLLRKSRSYLPHAAHGVLLANFFIHIPALFYGGIENSGFVWFFLFPLFAFFLAGKKAGMIWVSVFHLMIFTVFLISDYLTLPYEPAYLIFLLLALFIETIYVNFSNDIHLRYEREIAQKNRRLEELTNHLKQEVEEEVAKSRAKDMMLSQQSKMASVGEMMGHISHQWKQPLGTINVIVQNVQLARTLDPDDCAEVDGSLSEIIKQTDLMDQTIRDFLSFSRPATENKLFSIKHALKVMSTLVQSSLISKNISLSINTPETECDIQGRENEFVHALINIIHNAKDALVETKTPNPRITIDLFNEGEKTALQISDNAGGIPEDVMEHIFEPYFSTKQEEGGTGLGLHMTQKIIEESMGGTIEVSNTAAGARFKLLL